MQLTTKHYQNEHSQCITDCINQQCHVSLPLHSAAGYDFAEHSRINQDIYYILFGALVRSFLLACCKTLFCIIIITFAATAIQTAVHKLHISRDTDRKEFCKHYGKISKFLLPDRCQLRLNNRLSHTMRASRCVKWKH